MLEHSLLLFKRTNSGGKEVRELFGLLSSLALRSIFTMFFFALNAASWRQQKPVKMRNESSLRDHLLPIITGLFFQRE